MLPNESLLDVLHFSDCNTLAAAKFVVSTFLRVVTKHAAELPLQHNFLVMFFTSYVSYRDVTIGARLKSIRYEPGNLQSIAAACRELSGVIGAHAVANLIFSENMWSKAGVGVVFEAAPALKYADEVGLYNPKGSIIGNNSEVIMHHFTAMKTLRLLLDFNVFRKFSWTFLQHECARELRLIKGCIPDVATLREAEKMNRSVQELVRYCVTLPHLLWNSTSRKTDFPLRSMLKHTGSKLTFRMRTPQRGELMISVESFVESDYVVGVHNGSTRYASDKNGIVVEVKETWTVIQSTAEGPPTKKPRQSLPMAEQ